MNSIQKGTRSSISHFLSRLKLNGNKFTTTTIITPDPTQPALHSVHTNCLTTRSLSTYLTKIKLPTPFAADLFSQRHEHAHLHVWHQNKHSFISLHNLLAVPSFPAHTAIISRNYHYRRQDTTTTFHRVSNVAHFHGTRHPSSMKVSGESGTQVVNLAQVILTETEKLDVMAGSIPQSQVEKLIEELQTLGFDEQSIKTLLSGKLWLLQQIESTLALCRVLLDHELPPLLICQIFHHIPLPNRRDNRVVPDKINEMLLFLRNFGFTEREVVSLLEKNASVLFMDQTSTRESIEMVKSYFPSALAKKIVCASPNVLYNDWQLTHDKFNYVVYMMGYNQSDIVKSRMFSHSLHHIQDRHIFLERAGVFHVVNKKLHPSLNVNASLANVVDSTPSSFVKLVGGVTVQDYQIFKKMRKIEREKRSLDDDDDDDDDESDVDEDDYESGRKSKIDSKLRKKK